MKQVPASGARQDLSDFLKTRRAHLAPTDVGLPAGSGRRIRGLRREEVAVLAGVGLTWYTWLEQGRDIQVSAAFLDQVSRALKLSDAERAHLFALTQHRAPPHLGHKGAPVDADRGQAVLDAFDCPAYARNDCFDVLAWNDANTRMFGDFAAMPPTQRNILRLMFTRPAYRRTIVDWEADARALVAKFRLNFGQARGAERFSTLASGLGADSADFRRLWAEHDVSDRGEGVTRFSSPRHGVTSFEHHTLTLEALPHLRIVVFIPDRR